MLVAALRGEYHFTELTGADLLMSIHPSWQGPFVTRDLPREIRIDRPVPEDAIARLRTMPEFVRAYEPDGMTPDDFEGSTLPEPSAALTVHDTNAWAPDHRFAHYQGEDRRQILEGDWLRFTVVRDPWHRLWSAWVSKPPKPV